MSYNRNIYIGQYVELQAAGGGLHWILDETDPATIEQQTEGRATLEDIKKLKGFKVIFPEFMPGGSENFLCIMAPGFTRISDVARKDGIIRKLPSQAPTIPVDKDGILLKVFGTEELSWKYGLIMEVA